MRNIVITGSSTGFGRLAAERFARKGDRVFATMRDPDGKNREKSQPLRDLANEGLALHIVDLDVASDASVDAAAQRILAEGGAPDVVVNNAGQMFLGITEAFTPEEYTRQLDINVVGVHRVNRAFLPSMRAKGSGLIVNVSSVAGRMAMPFFGIYCASKWALEGYTQGMRVELAQTGVDTVLVEPGPFATELFGQAPAPSDAQGVGGQYPDVVHQAWAGMSQSFEGIFADADAPTDAGLVVDLFEQLADAAPGTRPLRIAVGLDFGVHERNRVAEQHDAQLLAAFQMEDLARLKTA